MPGTRRKHVPLRTCIVCHQQRPKRELVRIVRTPEGTIVIDPKGKQSGRGAYVCLTHECTAAGLKPDKLGRTLRRRVTPEEAVALRSEVESMLLPQDE